MFIPPWLTQKAPPRHHTTTTTAHNQVVASSAAPTTTHQRATSKPPLKKRKIFDISAARHQRTSSSGPTGSGIDHSLNFDDPIDEIIYEFVSERSLATKSSSGGNHWSQFREQRGKPILLEVNENQENLNEVCRFVMYFVMEAPNVNKFNTVDTYLGHVKDMHKSLMFTPEATRGDAFVWPADLADSRLRVLKEKVKQWFKETPQEEGGRLPFTPSLLKEMVDKGAIDVNSYDGRRVFCLILMTILGGFRMGELLPLTKDPTKRKTDKDCKIEHVHFARDTITVQVLGKTTTNFESVNIHTSEMLHLVELFGPIFDVASMLKSITANRRDDKLIFVREDGSPFTYNYFMSLLRDATDFMNIPRGHFGGHSGRIYLASLLALQGVDDSYIQTRGRWKSKAFKMYVRSLDKRKFRSQPEIKYFKLSNLNFVLKGFPMSPEFQKAQ